MSEVETPAAAQGRNEIKSQLGQELAQAFAQEAGNVPEEEQPIDEVEGEEVPLEEPESEESGDTAYEDIPLSAKERAKFLGVEPEFFYDVEYKLDNGDVMTVGDMKNAIQNGDSKQAGIQQAEILRQQHDMQAHAALEEQYGAPLRQRQDMLKQIEERYQSINWKAQIDEHGDQAELAKAKLQMQYSQLQNEITTMQGEYGTQMQNYGTQVAQAQFAEIVKSHPTWSDVNVAQVELKSLHEAIAGTGISYDVMMNEIGGTGGAMKLAILEMAAKGVQAGSIDKNKVKKKIRNIRSGRTITAKQQERMQAAQRMKKAKGGTRRERVAASVDLIRSSGGI